MSVVSSSSTNDSLPHSNISSISYNIPLYICCLTTTPSSFIFTSYNITYIILLLPLSIFIIYYGLQQWRQKTSSAATMSHSDSFNYNMVTVTLIGVFGSVLGCCGIYSDHSLTLIVGFSLFAFTWYGQMFFHVLTCVERYLAVVHPITYLSLRKERGTRIRNISIGCAWLLSAVVMSLVMFNDVFKIVDFFFLISSLIVVSFCSISVLCVLIRPGPGEQGGGRERVDQSKQRAFYTIMVILAVLMFRFAWSLVWSVLLMLETHFCVVMTSGVWCNLFSSLVLPLLFLHRAGKLACCKNNTK